MSLYEVNLLLKSQNHKVYRFLASSSNSCFHINLITQGYVEFVTGLPSSVVPCPSRASPMPDEYRALTKMSYWVPGCRFFRRVAVLSPFTDISFLGPPVEGLYATRYWSTFPGAGSQETFMEDTVSSKTLRSRGEPLAEKVGNKVRNEASHRTRICTDDDWWWENWSSHFIILTLKVYKMSTNSKKCTSHILRMLSNCLYLSENWYKTEKSNRFSSEKLEPVNVWYFW